MLAWCLGTRSSTWRARPWCSPKRPPRRAPLGCRPGTWRCKYLILIQIIHRLFRRREMCQNNFNWKIIWFEILLDFWAQFNPVCSCSAAHIFIMLTQSSKSSKFNDHWSTHSDVCMSLTLPFWPCPWTSRPPAGGRSCSPASCWTRGTSARCHKNTSWRRQMLKMMKLGKYFQSSEFFKPFFPLHQVQFLETYTRQLLKANQMHISFWSLL